jgi:hypothetical protein
MILIFEIKKYITKKTAIPEKKLLYFTQDKFMHFRLKQEGIRFG